MKYNAKSGGPRKRSYEKVTAKQMKEALTAALKRRGEVPWKFGTGKEKPRAHDEMDRA
jgi:hypothetical protein